MKNNGTRVAAAIGALTLVGLQAAVAQEIGEIVVTARRQGEEKLMETPLAITAFDEKAIERKGITNLQDVADLTPGLSFFNPIGENLPTPVIRGVVPQDIFGENSAAIFVDGVYVAGREGLNFSQLDIERIEVLKGPQSSTYGRNAFSGAINYVTKAPSDVFEAKGEVEGGNRGRRKVVGQVGGPIIGDTLTGRFSALYDEWDGSYDNSIANTDIGGYRYRSFQGKLRWRPVDSLDINMGLYRSNDEIDDAAVGGVLANCEDQVEQTTDNVVSGPGPRLQNWCGRIPDLKDLPQALDPAQFPNGVPLANSIARDRMPKNPLATGEDRDLVRGNLNVGWDTDFGTLSWLTGYSHTKQNDTSDFERSSGVSVPIVYCTPSTNFDPPSCNSPYNWSRVPMGFIDQENGSTTEEWSQEIRFTGPRDDRLRWQVGGYYFHSTQENRQGEIKATSQFPAGLDYMSGGNIALGPVALPTDLAIGSYIFGPSLSSTGGIDPLNRPETIDHEKSWSLFGAIDFDVTDRLQARAELRYTQDHKYADAFNYTPCQSPTPGSAYPVSADLPIGACGDWAYDLRVTDPVGYNEFIKDANGVYQSVARAGIESGSARFDNYTGRVGLKYLMDSGWMAYGSIAYGEKPGGINVIPSVDVVSGTSVFTETIFNAFDPEKITAYEIGLKGFTPDRRVRVDLAAFYNDWRNIVLRQLTDTDPTTGLQFTQPTGLNVNAGDARVFGWELTSDIGFTDTLTGRLSAGYTDSKLKNARQDTFALFPSFYTKEPSCDPAAIQQLADPNPSTSANEAQDSKAAQCRALSGDVSGNTQMRQPEWTASASLDYQRQISGDWDLVSSLSGSYTGKIFVGNDNQAWVPSHTNVNFNIGAESPRYTVTFWIRNLLNNDKPLSAFRDIYWTNDADLQATTPAGSGSVKTVSNFEDFPPLRMSISYPSLRTFGLSGKIRFGGAEK